MALQPIPIILWWHSMKNSEVDAIDRPKYLCQTLHYPLGITLDSNAGRPNVNRTNESTSSLQRPLFQMSLTPSGTGHDTKSH
jgi:hypothetical protein